MKVECFLFVLLAFRAFAQPAPHIGYVYPAGGQRGSAFQVTVGGQFLDGVTNVFVSGDGVQVSVVEFNKPMPQGQFNQLRDKMRELQDRKQSARKSSSATNVWSTADEKELTTIREKILKNPPNRQGNPAIAETATLKVFLATNAAACAREIRLGTPAGLSNPMVFYVADLHEFSAPPAKVLNPEAERLRERLGRPATVAAAKTETRLALPAIVNGQIMPGQADRFRFSARKGQRIVIAAKARELIPYLADAVPGWFQATLAVYDSKGHEVAYADDFRFDPDPVLCCEIPRDGDYVIEIKDSIYRGREDFVYRVEVGELPFITGVFPLGGAAGAPTTVEFAGWNLPSNGVAQSVSFAEPGVYQLSVTNGEHVSNLAAFAVDTLPESLEHEPNNSATTAQRVTLPLIVNGRIGEAGDADVFAFEGKAGGEIVVEVTARRLASPLDSVVRLTDATGKQIAFNDDCEDKGAGLETHHADSYLRATLPADGVYFVQLEDTQHRGGPEFGYRLRLSSPRPDFALRVVPSSLSVRGGATIPLTIFALRKDGFTNEIQLALKDALAGFNLTGAVLPAGQDKIRLTLTAPPTPTREPLNLALEGSARIGGDWITHPVVPADDLMQAFFYRHLVPAREFKVAVLGRGAQRGSPQILGNSPLRIPAGGTARVRIGAPGATLTERFDLELSEPPEGISIKTASPSREGTEIVFQADAAKAKPGLRGNLIVQLFPAKADARNRPQANARRTAAGVLPAISFRIVAADSEEAGLR